MDPRITEREEEREKRGRRLTSVLETNKKTKSKGAYPAVLGAFLPELVLGNNNLDLLNLILITHGEISGQAKEPTGSDEPLGGVIIKPPDAIAVIIGVGMVEIVVSLPIGQQTHQHASCSGDGGIILALSNQVGQAVYAKGGVPDEESGHESAIEEGPQEVQGLGLVRKEKEGTEESREDNPEGEGEGDVVFVLEANHPISREIRGVNQLHPLVVGLHEDPAHVGKEKSLLDGVGIILGVGEAMVNAVAKD